MSSLQNNAPDDPNKARRCLEDAVAALSVRLSAEEMAALEEPYVPHPVLGFS
jgi:hypothetical protein